MTLARQRLNIPEQMLADSFGISSTVASFATQRWIDLLYYELKFLIKWPSKEQTIMNLPNAFTQLPKTRAIIDCTEYFIQNHSHQQPKVNPGVTINTQIHSNNW